MEKARDMPVIHYHLGMIYLRLGEKERARESLRLALKGPEPFQGRKEAERVLKE